MRVANSEPHSGNRTATVLASPIATPACITHGSNLSKAVLQWPRGVKHAEVEQDTHKPAGFLTHTDTANSQSYRLERAIHLCCSQSIMHYPAELNLGVSLFRAATHQTRAMTDLTCVIMPYHICLR